MGGVSNAVRLQQLQADVDRVGPDARAHFDKMVADGQGIEFAAMCACQQPPGSKNTDRAFQDGARRRMENMGPLAKTMLLSAAKKAGINTAGKYYVGGLGRAHDPSAWVATAQDVKDVCKSKNLNAEGVVNHKATFTDKPPDDVALAPKLIREFAAKRLAADPGLAEKCRKSRDAQHDLVASIVETHGKQKRPKKAKRLA